MYEMYEMYEMSMKSMCHIIGRFDCHDISNRNDG